MNRTTASRSACVAALFLLALTAFLPAVEILQNVKLDPLSSRAAGTATLTSTSFDIGSIDSVFDGSVSSLGRTPNISPAFVQVAYTTARMARRFLVHCSYGTSYDWWVEKADTQADLDAKIGSDIAAHLSRSHRTFWRSWEPLLDRQKDGRPVALTRGRHHTSYRCS